MMTTAKVTMLDRLVGAFKMWRFMQVMNRERALRTEALEELMGEQRAQDSTLLAEALVKTKENN